MVVNQSSSPAKPKEQLNSPAGDGGDGGEVELPVLASPDTELSSSDDATRVLRRFHLGGPSEAGDLEPPGEDTLPALLDPFQDASKIRFDFPLYLHPTGDPHRQQLTLPVTDFLREAVEAFAPGPEQARILRDNLPRIERFLRKAIEGATAPVSLGPLLERAAAALQDELGLDEANRDHLQADLDRLIAAAPEGGSLIGYGDHATIHLFLHAIRHRMEARRRAFAEEVGDVVTRIRTLLQVEKGKSAEASEPDAVESAVGQAGSRYIDPVALAHTVGGSHGSEPLLSERRERIEKALASLEAYTNGKEPARLALVHDGSLSSPWLKGEADVEIKEAADPCLVASTVYDEKAAQFAEVFGAVRLAHLELSQAYDTALHDPWFSNFNWEAFARQELMLLPVVAAVASADRIAGKGLHSFSRLLRSGRPVQILAEVEPSKNHGVQSDEDPFASYRLELGYLGISHREALVAQSSLARPGHLTEGFLQALDGTRTGLHLINTGEESAHLSAWLQAGAALDGRAHPFFRYNPEKGRSWAQCVDFSENPEPQADWPRYPLAYQGAGEEQSLEVAFTFMDYALLDPALREHFRLVPEGLERDELTPVDAYLDLEPGEALRRLPVIWTVKGRSSLRRAVISRELLLACQDRLGYWRTLQALAGVRNEYADQAAQSAREQAMAEAAEERQKLEAEHAEELARVREQTAGEVMQHLTEVLMGLDLTQAPQPRTPSKPATALAEPTAEAPEEAPATAAEPEEEEEAVSFDNPYIDTMLCTSCNDCMKINALVFLYNENKQAYLGDLKAATYKDLVLGAEKCPARCIHPGKPQNPDEPGLDELMERAKPFN